MIFAFYITEPNGLQRLVFVRGTDYGNAFGKARRHAAFSGSTVRAGHLGDTPATDTDAKQAAGSLMLDEVSPGGNVISFGTTSGGGSLQQTNFFEGGGGAKVMASPLGDGADNGANGGGDTGGFSSWGPDKESQALTRESFEFGPGFRAGMRGRGINLEGGGGLMGQIARDRQRAIEDRFLTQEAFNPASALTEETAYPTLERFLSDRQGGVSVDDRLGDWTNPLFGRAGAEAARGLLDQARGFTSPATDVLPSDLAGGILNPATTGQGQTLANVALDAARRRYGSLSRFLPSAGALSESYLAQDRPTRGTFADFLNTRIFG